MAGAIIDTVAQDWASPRTYWEPAKLVFARGPDSVGEIGLDPCANDHSSVEARIKYKLPEYDGLEDSWTHDSEGNEIYGVFCNPPYSRTHMHRITKRIATKEEWKAMDKTQRAEYKTTTIYDWIKKAVEADEQGQDSILLIPASTDTAHWQELVFPHASAICFVEGRIEFELPDDGRQKIKGAPAPNASALVYFGDMPGRFARAYANVGWIVDPKLILAAKAAKETVYG